MFEDLFGKRSLVVNPALLERQLETEITEPRVATHLTSFAVGIDAILLANPMMEALVHDQLAPGIAGIYGHMRASIVHALESGNPDTRQVAQAALDRFDQVARLAQIPDPRDAAGDANEAGTAITIDEILQEAGIDASAPQEVGVSER